MGESSAVSGRGDGVVGVCAPLVGHTRAVGSFLGGRRPWDCPSLLYDAAERLQCFGGGLRLWGETRSDAFSRST